MVKVIVLVILGFIFYGCNSNDINETKDKSYYDILYKTNQKISYKDGDDGFFQKGSSRIYEIRNDYVIEKSKQLFWEDAKEVVEKKFTQDEGEFYCSNLNLGGYTDWRLPTLYELSELNDYSKYDQSIDKIFEYQVKSGYIWSSTDCGACKSKAFAISATVGDIYRFQDDNKFAVRCVRGVEYKKSNYERNDTLNIVNDTTKGLMWQDNQTEENKQKSFEESVSYCFELNFAGYDDWRLPNIIELRSLYDFTNGSRAMSLVFKNVVMEVPYWSSTTDIVDENKAWGLDFRLSDSTFYYKDSLFAVRCVRNIDSNVSK